MTSVFDGIVFPVLITCGVFTITRSPLKKDRYRLPGNLELAFLFIIIHIKEINTIRWPSLWYKLQISCTAIAPWLSFCVLSSLWEEKPSKTCIWSIYWQWYTTVKSSYKSSLLSSHCPSFLSTDCHKFSFNSKAKIQVLNERNILAIFSNHPSINSCLWCW